MIEVVARCDAVWPQRTPPECRALLPMTHTAVVEHEAVTYALARGWSAEWFPFKTYCPSCTRLRHQPNGADRADTERNPE